MGSVGGNLELKEAKGGQPRISRITRIEKMKSVPVREIRGQILLGKGRFVEIVVPWPFGLEQEKTEKSSTKTIQPRNTLKMNAGVTE